MKQILSILLLILVFSSVVYAIEVQTGVTFKPDSGATYIVNQTSYAHNITVNETCVIIDDVPYNNCVNVTGTYNISFSTTTTTVATTTTMMGEVAHRFW